MSTTDEKKPLPAWFYRIQALRDQRLEDSDGDDDFGYDRADITGEDFDEDLSELADSDADNSDGGPVADRESKRRKKATFDSDEFDDEDEDNDSDGSSEYTGPDAADYYEFLDMREDRKRQLLWEKGEQGELSSSIKAEDTAVRANVMAAFEALRKEEAQGGDPPALVGLTSALEYTLHSDEHVDHLTFQDLEYMSVLSRRVDLKPPNNDKNRSLLYLNNIHSLFDLEDRRPSTKPKKIDIKGHEAELTLISEQHLMIKLARVLVLRQTDKAAPEFFTFYGINKDTEEGQDSDADDYDDDSDN